MSKSPQGPWEVTSSVPQAIYEIPVSSPVAQRHLRHRGRGRQSDDWVTFAAVAGYTRHDGRVGLRGVGHRLLLPAVLGLRRLLPVLLPVLSRPTATAPATTRGPARTAVGRRVRPVRRRRRRARGTTRAPAPTRAARRRGDPYGARGAAEAYNPRTGAYGQTRQGSNVYGSWGSTGVQRGDDWARTARVDQQPHRQDDARHPGQRRRRGGHAARAAGQRRRRAHRQRRRLRRPRRQRLPEGGRHLAAVRRRRRWNDANTPQRTATRCRATRRHDGVSADDRYGSGARAGGDSTISQLDRDRAARTDGATRTRDAGTYRSGAGSTSRGGSSYGGSYRPSGGGMRGGGGRRR